MKYLVALLLTALAPLSLYAQLSERLLGANHPELTWSEVYTEHFILTYHQGLEETIKQAAPIAEEVYRVVTTNLGTPLNKRIRIYFSNVDEVKNAFAMNDDYIYIWMRGIVDDEPFAIRASGTSKWLRSVITHEFTHIVIEHATRDWTSSLLPVSLSVPRWFHEGLARFMEPDGWTPDLDVALRMAVVSGDLNLDIDRFLGGTIMYEGGQSLVRYMAATYGDSSIQKILKFRNGRTYNFDKAVQAVTKHSLDDIYDEWLKALIAYYGAQYAARDDIASEGRKIPTGLAIVLAARVSPDGKRLAILGKASEDDPPHLYLLQGDTGGVRTRLTTESGVAPYLTWSPDGNRLAVSKLHWGDDAALLYDLYIVDTKSGSIDRVTSNERVEQPDWSPDNKLVAVRTRTSGSDLVVLNADGSDLHQVTQFNEPDVNVYWPRWSPDGRKILFSIFRKNGQRDIALLTPASGELKYLTNDSINDRYAMWSPTGDSVVFVSFRSGVPNAYVMAASGDTPTPITNVASNITPWDWSASKDSILVSSFAFRSSVQLYWVGAHLVRRDSAKPEVLPQYASWRTVRLPLVTRTADSLAAVTVTGPFPYNSLANIRPFFYLPMIGSDLTRSGDEGTQWGALGTFRDNMGKHTIFAYAMYGDKSHQLSYEFEYKNSQLRPDIIVGALRATDFRQVIADRSYYERRTAYHIAMHLSSPSDDKLDASRELLVAAEYSKSEPWNLNHFLGVDEQLVPIDLTAATLSVKYDYLSPYTRYGINASHFNSKLGSTLTRTRLRGFFDLAAAIGESGENEIALLGKAAADFGDEVPQDYLGFSKYDVFEGGYTFLNPYLPDRIRGVRRYYYGNRLLYGALEIRHHDPIFGNLVPLIRIFSPRLVEWIETGTTWYASAPTNHVDAEITTFSKTRWLSSAGLELRSDPGFGVGFAAGVGWELVSRAQPDWYFRAIAEF